MANYPKQLAIQTYNAIPEGSIKHLTRLASMKFKSSMPLRLFLNRGECFVLVGTPSANKVMHAMDIVGPEGRVVVMEAARDNYESIIGVPEIQSAENVTVLHRAGWSSREVLELTVSKSRFDHKIEVPGVVHDNDFVPGNYIGTEQVQADTVDNVMDELSIDQPDFVEFHVNGAEIEILKGMPRTLSRPVRLHIKGHAKSSDSGRPIGQDIVEMLQGLGFQTVVGRTSKARTEAEEWGVRAGDVYAVKK